MPSKFDKFRENQMRRESRMSGAPEESTLAARWSDDRLFYEACSKGHVDTRLEFVVHQMGGSVHKDRQTIVTLLKKELEKPVSLKTLAVQKAEARMTNLLGPTGREFANGVGLDMNQVRNLFDGYFNEELDHLKDRIREAIDFVCKEI